MLGSNLALNSHATVSISIYRYLYMTGRERTVPKLCTSQLLDVMRLRRENGMQQIVNNVCIFNTTNSKVVVFNFQWDLIFTDEFRDLYRINQHKKCKQMMKTMKKEAAKGGAMADLELMEQLEEMRSVHRFLPLSHNGGDLETPQTNCKTVQKQWKRCISQRLTLTESDALSPHLKRLYQIWEHSENICYRYVFIFLIMDSESTWFLCILF